MEGRKQPKCITPKPRRKKFIWTILMYLGVAMLGLFLAYSAYTIGYKFNRCRLNKGASQLAYDTCLGVLARPDHSIAERQKTYNSLKCPEALRKIERSCIWHGVYSLYKNLSETIIWISTSSFVWVSVLAVTGERLYRWKNLAENLINADDDDDDDGRR